MNVICDLQNLLFLLKLSRQEEIISWIGETIVTRQLQQTAVCTLQPKVCVRCQFHFASAS